MFSVPPHTASVGELHAPVPGAQGPVYRVGGTQRVPAERPWATSGGSGPGKILRELNGLPK